MFLTALYLLLFDGGSLIPGGVCGAVCDILKIDFTHFHLLSMNLPMGFHRNQIGEYQIGTDIGKGLEFTCNKDYGISG